MNSNEGQPAETDIQERYEATVLDFLDKEMAMVQETKKKTEQSDELDALVTDLLKQVITEADQPPSEDKPLFDEDELFSGLTSGQKQVPETLPADQKSTQDEPAKATPFFSSSEFAKGVETQIPAGHPEPLPEVKAPAASAAVFGSSVVRQKKFPVNIVAPAAGLLLILGAAAYFFTGSSSKAPVRPEPQAAAAQAIQHDVQSAPAPVPAVTTQPVNKPAPSAVTSSKQGGAVVAAPPKANGNKGAVQPSGKATPEKTNLDPAPAVMAKNSGEERPILPPRVPVTPMPAQIAATIVEKQPPPADQSVPVIPSIPERKQAPPPQMTNAPEAPAQTAQSVAAPVTNRLIAAVPVMQASPAYPELALRAKASGSVVLEVQIDDQGKVVKATPVSGPAMFHNAAVTAVMKWRYKPASIGGVNVSSQSRVTLVFNLK